jgi:hypothetical protein
VIHTVEMASDYLKLVSGRQKSSKQRDNRGTCWMKNAGSAMPCATR